MATQEAAAPKAKSKAKPVTKDDVDELRKSAEEAKQEAEQNVQQDQPASESIDEASQEKLEAEEALEILEPKSEPKRWVIGKGPEHGGDEDTYSVYWQRPLGYMPRLRFFSLVSNTISKALRSGGTISLAGMGDITEGTWKDRAAAITEDDFEDAGSFLALAMQLIGHSPEFLAECYCLWLGIPVRERRWAKMVFEEPWDPENGKFGLSDDAGLEMVEIFIDQNYDDIREFFSGKLPRLVRRVQQREAANKALVRGSESVPSKP